MAYNQSQDMYPPRLTTMPIAGGQPQALAGPGVPTPGTGTLAGDVVPGGGGTGQATGPAWTTDPQFANMDPALKNIYTQGGLTPAGRGTGFADWQYWQDVGPSQYNRLAADIAGTGSDQPTGTPGAGAWMSSGRNATGGGTAGTFGGSLGGFSVTPFAAPAYNPATSPIFGASAPTSATQQALFDRLMGLASQSTNVSPDDPVIKAQTDAYRAEATRGARDYISAAAEKGGQNANMDAASRSAYEKAGQATAGFQGQAMVNELAARRQQIMQALSGASGLLTSEQSMQLQDQLAQLDAQLSAWGTTQSLGANESQFARNLAQNAYEFDSNMYNTLFGG